jgi:hypothetical protein
MIEYSERFLRLCNYENYELHLNRLKLIIEAYSQGALSSSTFIDEINKTSKILNLK